MVRGKLKLIKTFIVLILLIIGLQSLTKADDIREFEIEGISIGDSGLKIFSKTELNNKSYLYKSNKYASASKYVNDSNYDVIQIEFKDDGNYIIESLIFFFSNFLILKNFLEINLFFSLISLMKFQANTITNSALFFLRISLGKIGI